MLNSSDLASAFLDYLIAEGVIDAEVAREVLAEQCRQTTPVGRLALLNGWMTMKQVSKVLDMQLDSKRRFGEQAIALGYLEPVQLDALLAEQQRHRPGVGAILVRLGYATRGDLQRKRRAFLRGLETALA